MTGAWEYSERVRAAGGIESACCPYIGGPFHQPLYPFAASVIPQNFQCLFTLLSNVLHCFNHGGPVNLPMKDGVIHPQNN